MKGTERETANRSSRRYSTLSSQEGNSGFDAVCGTCPLWLSPRQVDSAQSAKSSTSPSESLLPTVSECDETERRSKSSVAAIEGESGTDAPYPWTATVMGLMRAPNVGGNKLVEPGAAALLCARSMHTRQKRSFGAVAPGASSRAPWRPPFPAASARSLDVVVP